MRFFLLILDYASLIGYNTDVKLYTAILIVSADILDFLFVSLPIILLTHLAFRIGPAYGRSRGGTALFAGSTIIILSYLFKIYFDFSFGDVDAYWLFVLTCGTAVGSMLAFVGTSRVYSFLNSTRAGTGRGMSWMLCQYPAADV